MTAGHGDGDQASQGFIRRHGIAGLLVLAAYVARPVSCMVVLNMEDRAPDDHYGSIDPHGFGALGAVMAALLCAPLVLPLVMGRRTRAVPIDPVAFWTRSIAAIVVLVSPMIMQLIDLQLSLPVPSRRYLATPILASSMLWLVIVGLCFMRSTDRPSIHAAFERVPRLSWAAIAVLAAAKTALFVLAMQVPS